MVPLAEPTNPELITTYANDLRIQRIFLGTRQKWMLRALRRGTLLSCRALAGTLSHTNLGLSTLNPTTLSPITLSPNPLRPEPLNPNPLR